MLEEVILVFSSKAGVAETLFIRTFFVATAFTKNAIKGSNLNEDKDGQKARDKQEIINLAEYGAGLF